MRAGRWIGLTALLLGGAVFAFIALRTDLLESVSREEVQARLDGRLQELERELGVADRDRRAFARIDWAAEPIRGLEKRLDEDPALGDLLFGESRSNAGHRELARQPEAVEAIRRLLSGEGAESMPGGEPVEGDGVILHRMNLTGHVWSAIVVASLDQDATRCAELACAQFDAAAALFQGAHWSEWLVGQAWMGAGLGALGAASPDDLEPDEERAFQVSRARETGARLAELLDADQRASVADAVRGALSAFPSNERTVLTSERQSLSLVWELAELEGGGPRVAQRFLNGLEAVRVEFLEMAAASSLEDMERQADELDNRLREAGSSWLGLFAGDPLSYASFLAPTSPTQAMLLREEAEMCAEAFLEALEN